MGDSSPAADKLMRSQGVRALPSFHFVSASAPPNYEALVPHDEAGRMVRQTHRGLAERVVWTLGRPSCCLESSHSCSHAYACAVLLLAVEEQEAD